MTIFDDEQIQILKVIMQAASDAIMTIYDEADHGVEYKEDESPLTLADKASHEMLQAGLETHFPDIHILSEEGAEVPYDERKNRTRLRSVDPLDGTKEFIKRNGEFAICLGLVEQGSVVFGMVALPAQGVIYWGGKAQGGAWKQTGIQEPTTLSPRTDYPKQLNIIGSRSHGGEEDQQFLATLEANGYTTTMVAAGSALKFCKVAEGTADIYPRFKPTMEWDTAAGHAILQGVGLDVIDMKTKQTMKYNRDNLRNNSFVAIKTTDTIVANIFSL